MRYLILTVLIVASPVHAQQAYSKSMAECAGLFGYGLANVNNPDAARIYAYGQDQYIAAALAQAQAEGVSDPANTVQAQMTAKQDEWQGKGMFVVLSEEFGDWIDYCRAFARAQDIDLIPD